MTLPQYWSSTDTGMPTMGKSTLLGWLGVIHRIREQKSLIYPDVPTIGQFINMSNEEEWGKEVYREVDPLG